MSKFTLLKNLLQSLGGEGTLRKILNERLKFFLLHDQKLPFSKVAIVFITVSLYNNFKMILSEIWGAL